MDSSRSHGASAVTIRGQGIGRALFDAAMRWATDRGIRHVQTTVWHENAAARMFYAARGSRPMTLRMELDMGKTQRKDTHRSEGVVHRKHCSPHGS